MYATLGHLLQDHGSRHSSHHSILYQPFCRCQVSRHRCYLTQCIRTAKKEYYIHEFTKYRNDIRETWDTLKDILNKKKSNLKYPPCFIKNDERITEAIDIADDYFTETGPKLASAIDTSGKPPFDSYLTKPCLSSFKFEYTNPDRGE